MIQRRPKRATAGHQFLSGTSSLDEGEGESSDYDENGTSPGGSNGRKRSKLRSALPSSAREVLDNWLSSHWHDPYPTPDEKNDLAAACHITVDQVNHWFINARVRRWRPTMEKAATKAKTTGSGAFAALVKDCGNENPFSKFLGPIGGLEVPGVPSASNFQAGRQSHHHLHDHDQYQAAAAAAAAAESAQAAMHAAHRLERHV